MTNEVNEMSAASPARPFPKVSPERLLEILRMNYESGDILCGDAADEIERLRLTAAERAAIEEVAANEAASASRSATRAIALRRLLWRTRNGSPEGSETVQ